MLAIVLKDIEPESARNLLDEELEQLSADTEKIVFKTADEVLSDDMSDFRCILAMSKDVAETLVNKRGTVNELRGMHNSDTSCPVIVTYGPSALIRSGYRESPYYPAFREDLQRSIDVACVTKASYSCVMAEVSDEKLVNAIKDMQSKIASDDIEELEDWPHITVLYGLHTADPQEVAYVVEGSREMLATCGMLSLFETDNFDVLKIDVQSEDLNLMHAALKELPHTLTHDKYSPHITIAYLRKGTGKAYLTDDFMDGFAHTVKLDTLIFSTPDKEKSAIELVSGDVEKRYDDALFVNDILKVEDDEDEDFTFVLTPILVPESVDRQGDIIDAEVIEVAAHDYMEHSQRPGFMHKQMLGRVDAVMVESFIARQSMKFGTKRVKKGTWIGGWRVYNPTLRQMIRDGDLNGVSIGGKAITDDVNT